MKNLKKALFALALGAVVGSPMATQAAPVATATAAAVPIDAEFQVGIAITQTQSLNYGTTVLSTTSTGGVLTITTQAPTVNNGTLTPSVPADILSNSGVTQSEFAIQGPANQVYNITLPVSATITCTVPGTCLSGSLTVDNFVAFSEFNNSAGATGTLDALGADNLAVGADLTYNAGEYGIYAGTFDVTVDY